MVIPFLTIYLTVERNFSLSEAGLVTGCFGMGSLVGTIIGGRLTDKYGFYPVMFWSLFIGGSMFFALQQMESFYAICITIFILTTIIDAFRPASMTSVAAYSTTENRTRSVSLVRLAINLGFSIGPAAGGIIALRLGYDWLFWIDGISCILAALFLKFFVEEKDVVKEEQEVVNKESFGTPYQDYHYLFFIGMLSLSAFAFVPFFSAVPVYFRQELLLNEAQIGGLLALNGLLIVLTEMPLIFVLQEKIQHLKLVAIGAVLIGCSYLIFNVFYGWIGVSIFALLAVTFGEILNIPFANTFALSRSNQTNRGKYMALYGNAYSIAHILSPVIGLKIAEVYGFSMLWYLLLLIALVSFVGFWMLGKRI